MIDLKTANGSYNLDEIENVSYARSEFINVDALTMTEKLSVLETVSETSKIDHLTDQWVIRHNFDDADVENAEVSVNYNLLSWTNWNTDQCKVENILLCCVFNSINPNRRRLVPLGREYRESSTVI